MLLGAPSIFAGAPSKPIKCQNCSYHLSSLKMSFFFRKSFLPPFSKSFTSHFLFFVRRCLWFVGVATLSAAVKVKFLASSFAVVGGSKRGTQMVFVRRGRTDDFRIKLIRKFRIKLIRKCIIFCICCFSSVFVFLHLFFHLFSFFLLNY